MDKIKIFLKENGLFLLTIAACLIFTFNFKVLTVSGNSMDTTLAEGEMHLALITDEFERGDIVVADCKALDTIIIKRVIGLPGETIEIKNNEVYINGETIEEPYINGFMLTPDISSFTLNDDEYFLCGDNRNKSSDSRMFGPIKRIDMIGKMIF